MNAGCQESVPATTGKWWVEVQRACDRRPVVARRRQRVVCTRERHRETEPPTSAQRIGLLLRWVYGFMHVHQTPGGPMRTRRITRAAVSLLWIAAVPAIHA